MQLLASHTHNGLEQSGADRGEHEAVLVALPAANHHRGPSPAARLVVEHGHGQSKQGRKLVPPHPSQQ